MNNEQTPDIQSDVPSTPSEFEALFEETVKTLHSGEIVTGTIAGFTPTEVEVDLGIKQSAYIPLTELPEGEEGNLKIGDAIESFVVRVSDVEGTVMLSRQKIESIRFQENIQTHITEGTVFDGVVSEHNKGGLMVNVKGKKVFVPASQSGEPRSVDLDTLIGKKTKLRITDFNEERRRMVGSIRSVSAELRKAEEEKFWQSVEKNTKLIGTVRSVMPYGLFVDIGGHDGLCHASELSWFGNIKPGDFAQPGDKIEVVVLDIDTEKHKVSLSHRRTKRDPWEDFIAEYHEGDTPTVTIRNFAPFGAFAEVIPGVEGLIHISQIADRRIARPAEVLKEGEQVTAKIIEIKEDSRRVSLSIRALLEHTTDENAEDTESVVVATAEPVAATEPSVTAEPAVADAAVPVAGEPVAEEPVAEEPVAGESVAEEPVAGESTVEPVEA